MRRIASACLLQTIKKLDNGGTKYVIEDKITEESGAIVVKIRKQYNSYPVKGYID